MAKHKVASSRGKHEYSIQFLLHYPIFPLLPFPLFCQVMGELPSESSVGDVNSLNIRHLNNIILLNISMCKNVECKGEQG